MAGAYAESGSLPSIYFEVFEWTETQALPPNYKCSGSKPPGLLPIRYTPHFPFPRRPSTLPSPENSSARLTQLPPPPSQPTQESTRFPHFLASAFLLAGHPAAPHPPARSSPRSLGLRNTWCPWKGILPPRPPPPSPGLNREPRPRGPRFLPAAPLEVTLAWLGPGRRRPRGHAGLSTLPIGPGGGRTTHLPAPLPSRTPGVAPLSPTRR